MNKRTINLTNSSTLSDNFFNEKENREKNQQDLINLKKNHSNSVNINKKSNILKLFFRALPGITRIARRLYVGNLNPNLMYMKEDWISFFTHLCKSVGIERENPVVSVWMHHEKNFCFVELRSIADTTLAVSEFQGFNSPTGRELKIGRPKNYEIPPSFLEDYILGQLPTEIPVDFNVIEIDEHLLRRIVEPINYDKPWEYLNSLNYSSSDFQKNDNFYNRRVSRKREIRALPIPGKGSLKAQRENPDATRVITLFQKLFIKEIENKDSKKLLLSEIKQECTKKGRVLDINVSLNGCSKGTVYVKFNSIDASIAFHSHMNGKLFSGKKILINFFSEDLFNNGEI